MKVEVKSARGIDVIPVETVHLSNRDIFLEQEINTETALDFQKQFLYLLREDRSKPIRIWINSPGGSVVDGLLIYDMITGVKNTPIYTIANGKCYSMAGVLFAAGHKGKRLMLPNSEIMLHEPFLSGNLSGTGSDMKSITLSLLKREKRIHEILMSHTGKNMDEIKREMAYDHYFDIGEAIAFGLCDRSVNMEDLLKEEFV